jgi:hypothetical protein
MVRKEQQTANKEESETKNEEQQSSRAAEQQSSRAAELILPSFPFPLTSTTFKLGN